MNAPSPKAGEERAFPFFDHRTVAEVDAACEPVNCAPVYAHLQSPSYLPPLPKSPTYRDRVYSNLYHAGHSCSEIAEFFGMSAGTVNFRLKRMGVKFRPQGTRGIGPVQARTP